MPQDAERWNNRIVQNLIYYQTNYFAAAALVAGLVALVTPHSSAAVAISVGLAVGAYAIIYVMPLYTGQPLVPAEHRCTAMAGALGAAALLMWYNQVMLHAVLLALLPVFAVLVHASLRRRNVSNKLVNLLTVSQATPMGWAIERLERCVGAGGFLEAALRSTGGGGGGGGGGASGSGPKSRND